MPNINDSKVVLVIGATAGIGKALALAIHDLPTKPTVVIAGRREERLAQIIAERGENRLHSLKVDVTANVDALRAFVEDATKKFPELDTVILSAGVQHVADFSKPETIDINKLNAEVATNYTAVLTLITFFLPHLLKLSRPAFLVPISSGLAMVPAPTLANYSATKAALHSLCLALNQNLSHTNVKVMEIIPPLVESELHDHQGTVERLSKIWMPLDEYTELALEGLKRGDFQNLTPGLVDTWKQFEGGKEERIAHFAAFTK